MIARVFAVTLSAFAIAALLMAFAPSRKASPGRWRKIAVYFLIVHLVLACAAFGRSAMSLLVAAIVLGGSVELYRATAQVGPAGAPRRYGIWSVYGAVGVGLVHSLRELDGQEWMFLYLVVACFDGFSQVIGQWLGRRPLAPTVSPGKTVEGVAGGFLSALFVSVLIGGLIAADTGSTLAAAAVIAGLGLVGDLCASWVKRKAGIKDFGRLLPEQGGLLDRFDSFLLAGALAAPVLAAAGA